MTATTTIGATNGSTDDVFIDSLPYFDNDLETQSNLQTLVDKEIARELKGRPPPDANSDPRLQPDKPLFQVRINFTSHQSFTVSTLLSSTSFITTWPPGPHARPSQD